MAFTERGSFTFKVRQTGSGNPFLYAEPLDGKLSLLNPTNNYLGKDAPNYRLLAFELADGIGFDEAESLAELLNEKISKIGITEIADAAH